jgi:adenylate cyclase
MLRNNPQLFNLYVGYEDGSFLEMDVIDRANPGFRSSLHVDEDAAYRVVIISRTGNAALKPVTVFLSENLIQVAETPGPTGYDPRRRPWYIDAFKDETTLLTGPYVFYATGQPGYTLRTRLKEAAVASWPVTCCSTAWKRRSTSSGLDNPGWRFCSTTQIGWSVIPR